MRRLHVSECAAIVRGLLSRLACMKKGKGQSRKGRGSVRYQGRTAHARHLHQRGRRFVRGDKDRHPAGGEMGKTYSAAELRERLPAMLRTAAIRRPGKISDTGTILAGENLIIRPTGPGVAFIQLDDLNADQLDRVRPAAFIIHAT